MRYMMEATVTVMNFPAKESEMKAPSNGVKLAVPPKLVRVLAALVNGMCSCVVR
jgi:hypothetical protein